MKDPYKVSQTDVDSIEQGICPKCQQALEQLDDYSYKCYGCNIEFYLLPEGQGIFHYECLECSHTMLGITENIYEPMICPKCSRRSLVRVINGKDNFNLYDMK